jgi:hypothetical protein
MEEKANISNCRLVDFFLAYYTLYVEAVLRNVLINNFKCSCLDLC